jgi:putative spermidine/putrescine transport system permease protein
MTAVPVTLAPARRALRPRRGFALLVVLLLAPIAVINLVAFIVPVLRLAQISFLESRSGGVLTDTYTLANYLNFLTDTFYLGLILNSLGLALAVTLATLVCAYPVAMFLHRCSPRWRNLLFVITVSPLLVSSVVRTYGWMVLLGDQGLVNSLLLSTGLIASPLRLVNNSLGVFIGLVEVLMPYMALSLIAGFGRLEASFEEAAASLGANAFTRFRRVVFPLTLPGVALGCLLCFVLAISSFITPKLLGGGRVFLLATEIYDQAIIQLEWPMAATISVIVLAVFGLALAAYARVIRRFD